MTVFFIIHPQISGEEEALHPFWLQRSIPRDGAGRPVWRCVGGADCHHQQVTRGVETETDPGRSHSRERRMTREQWAGLRAQERADDEKTMFEICESGDERKCAERVEWLTIPQAGEEGELRPASRNIASLVELALVTEVGTQLYT